MTPRGAPFVQPGDWVPYWHDFLADTRAGVIHPSLARQSQLVLPGASNRIPLAGKLLNAALMSRSQSRNTNNARFVPRRMIPRSVVIEKMRNALRLGNMAVIPRASVARITTGTCEPDAHGGRGDEQMCVVPESPEAVESGQEDAANQKAVLWALANHADDGTNVNEWTRSTWSVSHSAQSESTPDFHRTHVARVNSWMEQIDTIASYARAGAAAAAAEAGGVARHENNVIVSSDRGDGGAEIAYERKQLGKERQRPIVSVSIVTSAFVSTALSWLCHVSQRDIAPNSIVWVVLEDDVHRELTEKIAEISVETLDDAGSKSASDVNAAASGRRRVPLVVRMDSSLFPASKGLRKGLRFGTKTYWTLMVSRSQLVRDILARNVDVLLIDLDQTWLRDPMIDVHALEKYNSGGEKCDVTGALNVNNELMGNFLHIRASFRTQWLMRVVAREFHARLLAAYGSADGKGDEDDEQSGGKYIDNDQSILDMMLQRRWWTVLVKDLLVRWQWPPLAWAHAAKLCKLPANAVVDGTWYDKHPPRQVQNPGESPFASAAAVGLPAVINNNFIIGVPQKIARAKAHGHWFYDELTNRCIQPTNRRD